MILCDVDLLIFCKEMYLNGKYLLKRFECTNNIFNVIDANVTIGGVQENIPNGFYTYSQLAVAVQNEMIKQDPTATCVYTNKIDVFNATSAVNLIFNDILSELLGFERREFLPGAILSTYRPNLAPFSQINISWSGTRVGDGFTLTSDAPYGSRVIYIPAKDIEFEFTTATNPVISATSFGRSIDIQNASWVFEYVGL